MEEVEGELLGYDENAGEVEEEERMRREVGGGRG